MSNRSASFGSVYYKHLADLTVARDLDQLRCLPNWSWGNEVWLCLSVSSIVPYTYHRTRYIVHLLVLWCATRRLTAYSYVDTLEFVYLIAPRTIGIVVSFLNFTDTDAQNLFCIRKCSELLNKWLALIEKLPELPDESE